MPFIYFGTKKANIALIDAKLSDIAPTILDVMGLQKPAEMTGAAIFKFLEV